MNVWLQFAVWVVFIAVCVVAGFVVFGEDYAAAQHEALLDELWSDGGPVAA